MIEEEKEHNYSRRVFWILVLSLLFLFPLPAEKVSNAYFEIDVPEGLEVQDSAFRGKSNGGSEFHFILQQEGLNRLEETAFNNYMRIMITIFDEGEVYTNREFKSEMESYSPSELREIYDYMEDIFGLRNLIVVRNKRDIVTLGGCYALHLNCERKGVTEEKGNVMVDAYLSAIGHYTVVVSSSYRKNNRAKSLPLINKAVSSLVFLIDD